MWKVPFWAIAGVLAVGVMCLPLITQETWIPVSLFRNPDGSFTPLGILALFGGLVLLIVALNRCSVHSARGGNGH